MALTDAQRYAAKHKQRLLAKNEAFEQGNSANFEELDKALELNDEVLYRLGGKTKRAVNDAFKKHFLKKDESISQQPRTELERYADFF